MKNVEPERHPEHGHLGWAAVGGFVAAWDIWAALTEHETLSGAYARALRSPRSRVITTVATAYLVVHLQGQPKVLKKVDPLNLLGSTIRRLSHHGAALDVAA